MNTYTFLIVFLVLGTASLESAADWLDALKSRPELPEEFTGVYDPVKYRTSLQYQKENHRADTIKRGVLVPLSLLFIFAGGFNAVDLFARSFGLGMIATGLVFAGALSLLRTAIGLPFSIYDTFVIEEKYGFNKTSPRTFLTDLMKGLLLGALIGAPLFAGIQYFFAHTGPNAWLYSWAALTGFQLLLVFLAPVLLMPLFNKFSPLAEGALKKAIEEYAKTENFRIQGVYTMDGSKRSTKANAFFTGFGPFRRLVLFDTLIEKQSVEELTAVVAHEIGHFKLRHILKSMVLSIAVSGLLFYTLSLFLGSEELFSAFRMDQLSIYASLIFISYLYSPVLRLFSIFTHLLSRRFEFEADEYSVRTYGKPEQLVSALKKLSIENLSNLNPHPLKVWLDYTHPPVLQRIIALRKHVALEALLIARLKKMRCNLATVESCTGGLIAHRLTNVAGSSEVFWGSMVTYDNSAKERLAGVPRELLLRHGAVSPQVAQALAEGGLRAMSEAGNAQSRICASTTGIAGPGGGSVEKPVGLCFIGVAAQGKPSIAYEFRAPPGLNREQCKAAFADNALSRLLEQLAGENP